MSGRATAAIVVEVALGAGVLAGGLITVAASTSEPTTAATTSAPLVATAERAPATSALSPSPTTTARSATSSTIPLAPPTSSPTSPPATVAPLVPHRAVIDVLAPRPVAAPVRVAIPALEIDGPVRPAGVNGGGELDVPSDARSLVWYRHGPSPGQRGSAVIAGHLNWRGVTGLFADLASIPV